MNKEIREQKKDKNILISSGVWHIEPYITEKSTLLGEQGKVVFLISKNLNKIQVKTLVESKYGVHVNKVNNTKKFIGIKKYKGLRTYKRPLKKVIVTLKEGENIEFNV